jgi:hypothetical protein
LRAPPKKRGTEMSADPMAAVRHYIDVFNKGDAEVMATTFAVPGSILDGRQGDSAYVVVPATMMFKVGGKQVTQSDAFFTVALRKLAEGWRIAAWAWTKGTPR